MEKFTIQKGMKLSTASIRVSVDVGSNEILEKVSKLTRKSKRDILAEMIRYCYSRLEIIDNSEGEK